MIHFTNMMDDVPKKWVGGICIKDESILLIYRLNKDKDFNQEYFVFPGSQVGPDESLEDTLVRKFGEVSTQVAVGELFYSTEEDEHDNADYYYICDYLLGEPSLTDTSEESALMEEGGQVYTPMWVPLDQLEDMIVYPESVKNKVLFELIGGQ